METAESRIVRMLCGTNLYAMKARGKKDYHLRAALRLPPLRAEISFLKASHFAHIARRPTSYIPRAALFGRFFPGHQQHEQSWHLGAALAAKAKRTTRPQLLEEVVAHLEECGIPRAEQIYATGNSSNAAGKKRKQLFYWTTRAKYICDCVQDWCQQTDGSTAAEDEVVAKQRDAIVSKLCAKAGIPEKVARTGAGLWNDFSIKSGIRNLSEAAKVTDFIPQFSLDIVRREASTRVDQHNKRLRALVLAEDVDGHVEHLGGNNYRCKTCNNLRFTAHPEVVRDHIKTHRDGNFCRWVQEERTTNWRPAEQFFYQKTGSIILPPGKKRYFPPAAKCTVVGMQLQCRKCEEIVCPWNTRMNARKRGGAMRKFANHFSTRKGKKLVQKNDAKVKKGKGKTVRVQSAGVPPS